MNYKIFDTTKKHQHLDWIGMRWVVAYVGEKKPWRGNVMGAFQTRDHAKIFRDALNEIDYY